MSLDLEETFIFVRCVLLRVQYLAQLNRKTQLTVAFFGIVNNQQEQTSEMSIAPVNKLLYKSQGQGKDIMLEKLHGCI